MVIAKNEHEFFCRYMILLNLYQKNYHNYVDSFCNSVSLGTNNLEEKEEEEFFFFWMLEDEFDFDIEKLDFWKFMVRLEFSSMFNNYDNFFDYAFWNLMLWFRFENRYKIEKIMDSISFSLSKMSTGVRKHFTLDRFIFFRELSNFFYRFRFRMYRHYVF